MSCVHVFALLILFLVREMSANEPKDLVLVHCVFRHGDRTVETNSIYPNDPYINETYYPYGPNELTNIGKLREYNLGMLFRQRYQKFLGNLYTRNILDAWTTDFSRTKMSLQLVLGGLFPPCNETRWNVLLDWQPIPYNYKPLKDEKILLSAVCPNYRQYYGEYLITPKIQEKIQESQELFQYLSQHSGWNVRNYYDAYKIFWTLTSENEWGLKLPEWTLGVYPEPLRSLAIEEYKFRAGTLELRKLNAGYFLQKLVEDTQAKIDGTLNPQERKLFLYSGHDYTTSAILGALDIFQPHVPPYGSSIMFEISKRGGQHGIEIYYLDDSPRSPTLMKLPNCELFCAWEKFVAIVKQYFPSKDFCG